MERSEMLLGKLNDENFALSDKDSEVEVEIDSSPILLESNQLAVEPVMDIIMPEPSSLVVELENDKDFPEIKLPDYKDIQKVDSMNQPQASLITNDGVPMQLPIVEAPFEENKVSDDDQNQINFIEQMHKFTLHDETR